MFGNFLIKLENWIVREEHKELRKELKNKKVRDLTDIIEHFEVNEKRLGFSLEGLFATLNDKEEIHVNGELRSAEGMEPQNSIMLIASVHDSSGRVLGIGKEYVSISSFYMLKAFSIRIHLPELSDKVAKIRIYPEKS